MQPSIILQLGSNAPKQVFLHLCYRRGNRRTDVTCFASTEHAGDTQSLGVPIPQLSKAAPFHPETSSFTASFLLPLPSVTTTNLPSQTPSRELCRASLQSNHKELPKTFLPRPHFPLHGRRGFSKQQANSGNRSSSVCLVAQSSLTLCNPMDCSPPGIPVHGDSPGKNIAEGCHAHLQGIFPTQGGNPGLPHCRQILFPVNHQRSP